MMVTPDFFSQCIRRSGFTLFPGLLCFLCLSAFGNVIEESQNSVSFNFKNHLLFNSEKTQGFDESSAKFNHEVFADSFYDQFNLGVQFSNHVTARGDKSLDKPFVLEKKKLHFNSDHWNIQLGDSHHEWGRGIALSLYRDPNFGIDNTLEGGSVKYSGENLEAELIGGRMNSLTSPVVLYPTINTLTNRNVWLLGTKLSGKWDTHKLGTHYLLSLNQRKENSKIDKTWNTVGLSHEASWSDTFQTYVETNALLSRRDRLGNNLSLPTGFGSYLSLTKTLGSFNLKGEVKDYRKFNYEFRRPPNLEEDIVETSNITDVSGARLSGVQRFDWLTLSGSFLLARDRIENTDIQHGVLSTRFKGGLKTEYETKVGYRSMRDKNWMWHGSLKTKIPTFKRQSLELSYRKQYQMLEIAISPTLEDRNIFDLTYSFVERWNASLGYEYLPSNDTSLGRHFYSVSSLVTLGAFTGRAFIGQTSGGTQCSGGVCRQVPPYTGAYVDSTYSF